MDVTYEQTCTQCANVYRSVLGDAAPGKIIWSNTVPRCPKCGGEGSKPTIVKMGDAGWTAE